MMECSSLKKRKLGLRLRNRQVSVSEPFRFYQLVTFPLQKSGRTTGERTLKISWRLADIIAGKLSKALNVRDL